MFPHSPATLSIDELVDRIRREYALLPGLKLTEPQVRRLWDLDSAASTRVLRQLVERRVLAVTGTGHYVRVDADAQRPDHVVRA